MAITWWLGLPGNPAGQSPEDTTGPPPTERTACVRCTARKLAVKAEGVDVLDLGGRGWLWEHGTSPSWGGGARAWVGGGALPVRSGGARLHAQRQIWNQTPR